MEQEHSKKDRSSSDKKQEDILLIYCVAGLLTRVAYSDLIITDDEQQAMVTHLTKWSKIDHSIATQVMQIASQQMILLSGIENHKYCSPLITLLVESERYALLETLFHIANSDGETSPTEQEEIRSITIGLGLPHRYFTAARAKVMNLA